MPGPTFTGRGSVYHLYLFEERDALPWLYRGVRASAKRVLPRHICTDSIRTVLSLTDRCDGRKVGLDRPTGVP